MTDRPLTPAQTQVLLRLTQRFATASIDQLWVFPPRKLQKGESGLFVLSLFTEPGDEEAQVRTLVTVRYHAAGASAAQITDLVSEEGRAPPDNIDRIIVGVLARAGVEGGEPTAEVIGGREEAWQEMLARLGIAA